MPEIATLDSIATVPDDTPLTPGNVGRMDSATWAKTFMPSIVEATTAPTETPVEAPAGEPAATRGPDGKFVAKAETPAVGDDTAPITDTPPITEAPPETPPVQLPFAAVGADGAAVDPAMLAGMSITLKANGVETQMALPDLVRQAQSAAGASRQANELRTTITQREAQVTEMTGELQILEQALQAALTDDDARAHLAQRYREFTAPEAELSRLKAQQAADADLRRVADAQAQFQSTAVDFHRQISGVFDTLLTRFPDVTPEELFGRFNIDTAPWAVHGVISPEKYPEVEAYVAQSLTAYAQQRHAAIGTLRTKADAATKAAEQAALAAKNTMAAAVRPVGASAASGVPGKPQITTLKDATAYAIGAFSPG